MELRRQGIYNADTGAPSGSASATGTNAERSSGYRDPEAKVATFTRRRSCRPERFVPRPLKLKRASVCLFGMRRFGNPKLLIVSTVLTGGLHIQAAMVLPQGDTKVTGEKGTRIRQAIRTRAVRCLPRPIVEVRGLRRTIGLTLIIGRRMPPHQVISAIIMAISRTTCPSMLP